MPAAARRIEKLRLTAWREEDVPRARLLVEDAFRIASFPDGERRLFILRRLDLGNVELDRSSAALAPVIETAVRSAASRAVRFDDPGAGYASAVYFPDAVEAVTAFIVKLASGTGVTEWFWPLVFREWHTTDNVGTAPGFRLAIQHLLRLPGAGHHIARAIEVLRNRRIERSLLECFEPSDAAVLSASLGLSPTPVSHAVDEPSLHSSILMSPEIRAWHSVIAVWATRWGRTDLRTLWLAAVPLVITRPALLHHADLTGLSTRLLRHATAPVSAQLPGDLNRAIRRPEAATLPETRDSLHTLAHVASASTPGQTPRDEGAPGVEHGTTARVLPSFSRLEQPARREDVAMPTEMDERVWDGDLRDSTVAGLLFVAPILSRLLMSHALESNAVLVHMQLPERLLALIATRCGAGETDPLRLLFSATQEEVTLSPFIYLAPAAWRSRPNRYWVERVEDGAMQERRVWTDRSGRVLYALWRGDAPAELATVALPAEERVSVPRTAWLGDGERVLESWFTQVRRVVHRVAGIGLRTLVARDGKVAITRTHLDIVLPLAEVDMRIRRAGLDADPGWIPWLGRVVSYHYEAES